MAGNSRGQLICWLSGPTGYEKSALSHTIVEHYEQEGMLIGNFFCCRGAGHRSILGCLVPMLSYQLYLRIQITRRSIENALEADPLITTTSSAHQSQKLIIEPIGAVSNLSTPALIIIIDGLDECNSKQSMWEFIEGVIHTSKDNHRLPLWSLITSRVEEHVRGDP
jgi:hypothetical protein